MEDFDSSDEDDDFSDSQLLSGESTAESDFTSDASAAESALESQQQQHQQQQQVVSPSEQFLHPETADAAAVAGHPHDAGPGSTTQQHPQQTSHPHSSEPRLDASPGSPQPITFDVAKVTALALAKINGGDPTILNAGLPHDYRRSPTQSKVVSC